MNQNTTSRYIMYSLALAAGASDLRHLFSALAVGRAAVGIEFICEFTPVWFISVKKQQQYTLKKKNNMH